MNINKILGLGRKLVLASASPRRKLLMEKLGFEFEVIPSNIDESVVNGSEPELYVKKLAELKAFSIAESQNNSLVIGSDTIVVIDGEILNKPNDKEHASYLLNKLSGRTHTVHTGICIVDSDNNRSVADVQCTKVTFRNISQFEIDAYIETGSPLDKAGAYGIQDDFGAVFVSNIEGCYYNIVGLPLELLYSMLKNFTKEG